jgi:hypothetical protein
MQLTGRLVKGDKSGESHYLPRWQISGPRGSYGRKWHSYVFSYRLPRDGPLMTNLGSRHRSGKANYGHQRSLLTLIGPRDRVCSREGSICTLGVASDATSEKSWAYFGHRNISPGANSAVWSCRGRRRTRRRRSGHRP